MAGASGLIGTEVRRQLVRHGHEVRTLVRRPIRDAAEWQWDPAAGQVPAEAIEWADAVIGLSGSNLARLPWTHGYKRTILRSRTGPARTLATAIRASQDPPAVWVNASASGIYGHRPGEQLTEASARGTGFLSEVVARWERAAQADERTRVVHARTGIVLALRGALRPLMVTTRLGLAATIGNGRQHWPWISLRDEARAIVHLATGSTLAGPVNLAGPVPATSREITRELAHAMRRPHLFGLPGWALRAGLGTAADDLLLADQHVAPQALVSDGFGFEHTTVEGAIAAMLVRGA